MPHMNVLVSVAVILVVCVVIINSIGMAIVAIVVGFCFSYCHYRRHTDYHH